MVTNEVKDLVFGLYGKTPTAVDPEVQKKVLKGYKRGEMPVTGRAADYLEPELDRVKTLAVWADGEYGENFEYSLEGTPCKGVVGQTPCCVAKNVRQAFPDAELLEKMKAESYLGVPLFDSSGRALGLIAAMHDKPLERLALVKPVMSIFAARAAAELERAHAEEERERLLWVLEAKNRELESIVYTSSHDLRSTIVNVQGFSSELATSCRHLLGVLEAIPVPEDLKDTLLNIVSDEIPAEIKYITTSAEKMDMLITGLLKLSRLGRVQMKPEDIDMNVLMNEVVNSVRYQIRETGTEVAVDDLPRCRADVSQITQIFWNLIDNAMKYRDPVRNCVIDISGYVEENVSIYCVADNGKGISPKHQKNIFEVFHRLEPEGPVAGEGLGLSIIRRIVDRHGGKVWVESEPGEGSRFFVSLPGI